MMKLEVNRTENGIKLAGADVNHLINKIELGGGAKATAKQHEKNKLTARERIKFLLDDDTMQLVRE